MKVVHSLTVQARCPVDSQLDTYEATFTASRVVKVEDILAAIKRVANRKVFQEDLTCQLARELGMSVTTIGYHSGVRTEVSA